MEETRQYKTANLNPKNKRRRKINIQRKASTKPKHSVAKKSLTGTKGRYTNNSTSSPPSGIPRLQTLLIASLSKVILSSMNHDHSPNDTFRSNQFDMSIFDGAFCCAGGVGGDVS